MDDQRLRADRHGLAKGRRAGRDRQGDALDLGGPLHLEPVERGVVEVLGLQGLVEVSLQLLTLHRRSSGGSNRTAPAGKSYHVRPDRVHLDADARAV